MGSPQTRPHALAGRPPSVGLRRSASAGRRSPVDRLRGNGNRNPRAPSSMGAAQYTVARRRTLGALYRLFLGIADGMPIARVWAVPALTMSASERRVILSTGTPIPAQWTCRRRCRGRADVSKKKRSELDEHGPVRRGAQANARRGVGDGPLQLETHGDHFSR